MGVCSPAWLCWFASPALSSLWAIRLERFHIYFIFHILLFQRQIDMKYNI